MFNYYGSYDVVVCGGGTSGIAAAVASARAGAKTLLIERVGQLGGQMNFSGPPGFSYAWLYNARHELIVGGFAKETYDMMLKDGHALPEDHPVWRSDYQFNYIDPDWFGMYVYEMLYEAGAELMLHALVTDVVKEDNIVKGVIVEHPGGKSVVFGKVIIDCTGEGEVCYQAGAEYDKWEKDLLEPATVAFTCDGINWDEFMNYFLNNLEEFDFAHLYNPYTNMDEAEIRSYIKENAKKIEDIGEVMGFVSLHKKGLETGEWHKYSGMGFFIMPREGGKIQAHFQHSSQVGHVDCTDVRDLTKVEIEARKQDVIAFNYFKKYVPGFENMYITRICPEARIRETRRIMGDYVLTMEDVSEARKFDDVIGKSSFPSGPKHVLATDANTTNGTLTVQSVAHNPKDGGSNDIPYRCLVVKGLENILVAGKAISTDRPSHNRFLQQTIVTGQAAGCAAAVSVKEGITPRELEDHVKDLQKVLLKQGAILYGTY